MHVTPKNIVKHELIGLHVEVVASTDKSKIGTNGTVINETRGMLHIETKNGEKRIPKKECTFRFLLGEEKVDVKGEKLISRPEDRIKKQSIEKW